MKLIAIKKLREELSKNRYKCKSGCYECCTTVPVLEEEMKEIVKELRKQGYEKPPNGKGDAYCEMLTPEGRCSVYNVRPLICRSFSGTKYRMKHMGRETLTPSCTYGHGHIVDASVEFVKYGMEIMREGSIIGSTAMVSAHKAIKNMMP